MPRGGSKKYSRGGWKSGRRSVYKTDVFGRALGWDVQVILGGGLIRIPVHFRAKHTCKPRQLGKACAGKDKHVPGDEEYDDEDDDEDDDYDEDDDTRTRARRRTTTPTMTRATQTKHS